MVDWRKLKFVTRLLIYSYQYYGKYVRFGLAIKRLEIMFHFIFYLNKYADRGRSEEKHALVMSYNEKNL